MEEDDPRTPLLGPAPTNRYRRAAVKLCSLQSWRRRLPITIWLPKYRVDYFFRDLIAGITVGLTSIPQGIAYAIIAGLPPQVGLYSSIFPGIIYALFGSCKDVTLGPTAILSALLAKYVAYSDDFAYLAAFLSGCVILLLGVLQLGFLLDFISKPVISGFTTAAALQIGASQLKTLFRVTGTSGGNFINALINFFKNIKTIHLWDSVLGIVTIFFLILLKRSTISVTSSSSRTRVLLSRTWVYGIRARNAIVVFAGAGLAYGLYVHGYTPFALTGKIQGGLPKFAPPPFSTTVGNKTVDFEGMLSILGPQALVMPLVAILESIAIAKAFAGNSCVDGTQEMLALGACNIISSCCGAMPTTGSFTRTALNHASGVMTPAGSLFKACLVLLAVTLLSEVFYFIPRPTLAAVIIVAMFSIIDLPVVTKLWRNSKWELLVYIVTVGVGCLWALEYGIVCGAAVDLLRAASTHSIHIQLCQVGNNECAIVTLAGSLRYAGASHIYRELSRVKQLVVVIDGRFVSHIDFGVAESMISAIEQLTEARHKCLLWNFNDGHRKLLEDLKPELSGFFVSGPRIDQIVLSIQLPR